MLAIRVALGLTQQEFATAIGVSQRSLQKWEAGEVKKPRLTIRQVLRLTILSKKTISELAEILDT